MPVPRRKSFIPQRMPSEGTMAYYPAFPPAIRLRGVGCIRVAHPCATLKAPEGALPVRLACIRPAASVHPEPGSNSSLYYCLASVFTLNLGFRLDTRPWFPKGPLSSRRSRGAGVLCWPQTFKELSISFSILPNSIFQAEMDCKVTTIFCNSNQKFQLFLIKHFILLIIK